MGGGACAGFAPHLVRREAAGGDPDAHASPGLLSQRRRHFPDPCSHLLELGQAARRAPSSPRGRPRFPPRLVPRASPQLCLRGRPRFARLGRDTDESPNHLQGFRSFRDRNVSLETPSPPLPGDGKGRWGGAGTGRLRQQTDPSELRCLFRGSKWVQLNCLCDDFSL